jgi:7-cyano-7-deazaguanine reductase
MSSGVGDETLLGRHTPVHAEYAPHILQAIPRNIARETLRRGSSLTLHGADVWHAYEMSWLDTTGKPVVRVGKFSVPCSSPNIVESKSFKLYLNSLNSTRIFSEQDARELIVRDISRTAGEGVSLQLLQVDDASLAGAVWPGDCLDDLVIETTGGQPDAGQLQVEPTRLVEEAVYSHLLRSLCPVTGQPDWATVWIHYSAKAIDRASLLQYIIAYREHQEFHEQCVERMFSDLTDRCEAEFLHIQAFYTRRGGLDINPFRSTHTNAAPLPRLDRQ